jgi:4-hydroxyproline epimerase
MATLLARGELQFGERWHQESVTGGLFTGWLERSTDGRVVPNVRGRAFITGESTLLFDSRDPFMTGLPQA